MTDHSQFYIQQRDRAVRLAEMKEKVVSWEDNRPKGIIF